MQFAESNGYITDEQYGGRKHRMAQSAVLNKIAYYNISHQTLTGCAFMDDDARACYDRIVSTNNAMLDQPTEYLKHPTLIPKMTLSKDPDRE